MLRDPRAFWKKEKKKPRPNLFSQETWSRVALAIFIRGKDLKSLKRQFTGKGREICQEVT